MENTKKELKGLEKRIESVTFGIHYHEIELKKNKELLHELNERVRKLKLDKQ